jgi:hypothetical protein
VQNRIADERRHEKKTSKRSIVHSEYKLHNKTIHIPSIFELASIRPCPVTSSTFVFAILLLLLPSIPTVKARHQLKLQIQPPCTGPEGSKRLRLPNFKTVGI